ncbi:MAG: glutamyl-tRNA reductase [Dehalococcoidia bacterium]|nr:glutamyl-tRNA reductase [Dehalococcoidia bacterium]
MHISLVGINHRTAPVDIREKMAIRAAKLGDSLSSLKRFAPSGVILSTCNRTEIYTANDDSREPAQASLDFLSEYLDISIPQLLRYAYIYKDTEAVEHLFRIASGLDSMIIGEFEVLGQVGNALDAAEIAGMMNLPLRQLFQSAIRAGRRVRKETGISKNALSVSSVAVELAIQVIRDPATCKMVVIGAGEAGRLVAKAARDRGITRIYVAGRTQDRASALVSELGGTSFRIENLEEEMKTADMVVTCADAPHCILRAEQIERTMKERSLPMVIIDIAVPRNAEPAIKQMANVFLHNIDDLTQISEQNRKQREAEILKASEIVAAEVAEFNSWWQSLDTRHVVGALMSKADAIRAAQLDKTLRKLRPLTEEEREDLEAMTKSIVTRILQGPVNYLKSTNGDGKAGASVVSELFELEPKE